MSSPAYVDDLTLDQLEPTWWFDEVDDRLRGRVELPVQADPPLGLVASVVDVHDLSDLVALARALVDRSVRSWDGGGLSAAGDDVLVWDALDRQARTSRPALARLLVRSLAAARAADPGRRDDVDEGLMQALSDLS
jgi:hypothetical protein